MGVDPGVAINQMTMEVGVDKANELSTTQASPSSLNPLDLTRAHWPYVYLIYICSETGLVGLGFSGVWERERKLSGAVSKFEGTTHSSSIRTSLHLKPVMTAPLHSLSVCLTEAVDLSLFGMTFTSSSIRFVDYMELGED